MQLQPDLPSDAERARLDVLKSDRLDGPAPAAAFDRVVLLAAHLFEVPTVPVSVVGEHGEVMEWRVGLDAGRASPADFFTRHAAPATLEVA